MTNNNEQITLMNFLINKNIKSDFTKVCKLRNTSMTSELNRFIRTFIVEQNTNFKEYLDTSTEVKDLYNRKIKTSYTIGLDKCEASY